MIQKIIKVGNSAAVTIPKDYLIATGVKVGTEAKVELHEDTRQIIINLPVKNKKQAKTPVSDEFKRWLGTFLKEDKELLQDLAER